MQHSIRWPTSGTGALKLAIEWPERPTEEGLEDISNRLLVWGQSGALGAFPLFDLRPSDSSIVIQIARQSDDNTLDALVDCRNIDHASLGVLANLLLASKTNEQAAPAKLSVFPIDPSDSDRRLILQDPGPADVLDYYPSGSNKLQLIVERDASAIDVHKSRRAWIVASREYSADEISDYQSRLECWALLVELGGYARPVRPPSKALVQLDCVELYDDHVIDMNMSYFEAVDQAWLPLFNMLEKASLEVCPLRGVYVW